MQVDEFLLKTNECNSKSNTEVLPMVSFETYYSNGSICELKHFDEDGQLHGSYKSYYINGLIEIDCTYVHGLKQGIYFEYTQIGNILFSAIFDKNVMVSYIKF